MKRSAATPRPLQDAKRLCNVSCIQFRELDVQGYTLIDLGAYDFALRHRHCLFWDIEYFREGTDIMDENGNYLNPSSFHNHTVRDLRMIAHQHVRSMMNAYFPNHNLEQLIDSLSFLHRRKPKRLDYVGFTETTPDANDDDAIFGAFINLDSFDQTFACIPKTHSRAHSEDFSNMSKKDIASKRVKVNVPPGHMILYHEHIFQFDYRKSNENYDSVRLNLGWRITKSDQPLDVHIKERLEHQDVIKLRNGETPKLFDRKDWLLNPQSIEDLALDKLSPACRIVKKRDGKEYIIPYCKEDRTMHSLRHYKVQMYPKYSEEELKMYVPTPLSESVVQDYLFNFA